jgi:hypothetical protein
MQLQALGIEGILAMVRTDTSLFKFGIIRSRGELLR